MDWSTVFLSAGVSTLISAVVALAAVPRTVALTERAKRRVAASLALEELVGQWGDELARYRVASPDRAARGAATLVTDDLVDVQRVLRACADLSWFRRTLVAYRLKRIYGRGWVRLAHEYPTAPTGDGAFTAILATSLAHAGHTGGARTLSTDYLLHRVYSTAPEDGPATCRTLAREFRRLQRGR